MTKQKPQQLSENDRVEIQNITRLLHVDDEIKLKMIEGVISRARSRPAPASDIISELDGMLEGMPTEEERSKKRAEAAWQQGFKAGAAQARVARDAEWATTLNTLISTESVRFSPAMVDMVYSYRVAQIIKSLRSTSNPAMEGCEDDMEQEARR